MKLLISPGFPRCGTSYLYYQLAKINGASFNSPSIKEPNFFHRDQAPEVYLSQFATRDDDNYYLDFSASYLAGGRNTIERILSWSREHMVKCVIILRHPVEQAFSHYLYDIAAHITRFEFGYDVSYDFFARKSVARYLTSRFDMVNVLVKALGRNVLVLNYHRDIPDAERLRAKMEAFIERPLEPFSVGRVNPCGWLPQFIYGAEGGTNVALENHVATLPKGSLLLVSNHMSKLWPSFDPNLVDALHRGASTWCRSLNAQQCAQIYQTRFRRDFEKTLSIVGEDIDAYPMPGELTAATPRVSRKIFEQLANRRSLSDSLRSFSASLPWEGIK